MKLLSLASLFLSATVAFAAPTPTLNEGTATIEKRQACNPSGISSSDRQRVISAFQSSGVVPTLIPSINPKVKLNVNYPAKAVNLGNQFTTLQTLQAPTYGFSAEPGFNPRNTKYSFFMIDPDVPNPQSPVRATYLHWYVSGNQPSCVSNQNRRTVTIYQNPSPASTQQHRYTFLVYREPANYQISATDLVTLQARPGFNVNAYAQRKGLVLVGGNFFREAITNT